MNTVYIYELCTGLFLTVMFSNSRFSIINNCWSEEHVHLNLCTMERVRLYFGRILCINHWWQKHSFSSMILSIYALITVFFILIITCSFFLLFLSLSLTPLCFHKYFVFLSFKHQLLNHNHRSSRMFFMFIYTSHSPDLSHELQHFNQCYGWMLGYGLVWSIHDICLACVSHEKV